MKIIEIQIFAIRCFMRIANSNFELDRISEIIESVVLAPREFQYGLLLEFKPYLLVHLSQE